MKSILLLPLFILIASCGTQNVNTKTMESYNKPSGTWKAIQIEGITKQQLQEQQPTLTFNELSIHGFDGCNSYSTALEKDLTGQNFKIDAAVMQTRKYCPDKMDVPQNFIQNLRESTHYTITNQQLILYNKNNEQLITLTKSN